MLLQKTPHIIAHGERVRLFRRAVADEKVSNEFINFNNPLTVVTILWFDMTCINKKLKHALGDIVMSLA